MSPPFWRSTVPGCNRCHGGIVVIKTAALDDPKGYIERDFPCRYCFPTNRLEAVKKLGIGTK